MTYVKENKGTIKVSLGYRMSQVESMSKLSTFGDGMWGAEIRMENGDSFGMYSKSKIVVESFKPGILTTYELIKVVDYPDTDKQSVKFRIENYNFDLPRKERFEAHVVDKIADAIFKSTELAVQYGPLDQLESYSDRIYLYLKHKLLSESFDFDESDTKAIVGKKPKTK